jgi:predicted transposase YdaD
MSQIQMVRGRNALPPEVQAHLDLATLKVCPGSFVDDELRDAHPDLLYTTHTRGGGEALVYVLLEYQSTFDARMPLRLLRYMVRA